MWREGLGGDESRCWGVMDDGEGTGDVAFGGETYLWYTAVGG